MVVHTDLHVGKRVFWNDPENKFSGVYRILEVPLDINKIGGNNVIILSNNRREVGALPKELSKPNNKGVRKVLGTTTYVRHNGSICPSCKSTKIEAEHFEDGYDSTWRKVLCKECDARWAETYKLSGYKNLELPDKPDKNEYICFSNGDEKSAEV